jgi:heterodisulfide reductase subunit C
MYLLYKSVLYCYKCTSFCAELNKKVEVINIEEYLLIKNTLMDLFIKMLFLIFIGYISLTTQNFILQKQKFKIDISYQTGKAGKSVPSKKVFFHTGTI